VHGSVSTSTALVTPWRYPQPGVSGQYLTGDAFPDYCPVVSAYSNGDCQDTSLNPTGTNYYGSVYSVRTAVTLVAEHMMPLGNPPKGGKVLSL
jgi:hypothetical protein